VLLPRLTASPDPAPWRRPTTAWATTTEASCLISTPRQVARQFRPVQTHRQCRADLALVPSPEAKTALRDVRRLLPPGFANLSPTTAIGLRRWSSEYGLFSEPSHWRILRDRSWDQEARARDALGLRQVSLPWSGVQVAATQRRQNGPVRDRRAVWAVRCGLCTCVDATEHVILRPYTRRPPVCYGTGSAGEASPMRRGSFVDEGNAYGAIDRPLSGECRTWTGPRSRQELEFDSFQLGNRDVRPDATRCVSEMPNRILLGEFFDR
jgi:hypothetical protein